MIGPLGSSMVTEAAISVLPCFIHAVSRRAAGLDALSCTGEDARSLFGEAVVVVDRIADAAAGGIRPGAGLVDPRLTRRDGEIGIRRALFARDGWSRQGLNLGHDDGLVAIIGDDRLLGRCLAAELDVEAIHRGPTAVAVPGVTAWRTVQRLGIRSTIGDGGRRHRDR